MEVRRLVLDGGVDVLAAERRAGFLAFVLQLAPEGAAVDERQRLRVVTRILVEGVEPEIARRAEVRVRADEVVVVDANAEVEVELVVGPPLVGDRVADKCRRDRVVQTVGPIFDDVVGARAAAAGHVGGLGGCEPA